MLSVLASGFSVCQPQKVKFLKIPKRAHSNPYMIHNCEVEGVVLSVQACRNKSEDFFT